MSLKITNLKLQMHPPGANELTHRGWIYDSFLYQLRPGTPVLEVIFNKYLIFEFSTGPETVSY